MALLSKAIQKSPVQEPLVAMLLGIAVGPHGLQWLDIAQWGEESAILEQASRLTLAIGLMGVALRLGRDSMRALWRPAALLLSFGMLGMWLASSAVAGWLLGLSLWSALLVGAVITPTDPVVASSIVTGKFATTHLPLRVRDTISLESGANDGLAYLFVMLPILVVQDPAGGAWQRWLVESVVLGAVGAALFGAVIGWAAAACLAAARRSELVERISLLGYTVAFSMFTLGAARLLDMDALISVFVAGLVFNLCAQRAEEHEEEQIQEAVAKLFTLPMFVVFGLALPWAEWAAAGWPLLATAVLVLVLRRLPVVAALFPWLRSGLNRSDTAFVGWFGPIGIAAIFYASFARSHLHDPTVWHIASALVFASILVHGLTAAPFTRLYARYPAAAPPATAWIGDEYAEDGRAEEEGAADGR